MKEIIFNTEITEITEITEEQRTQRKQRKKTLFLRALCRSVPSVLNLFTTSIILHTLLAIFIIAPTPAKAAPMYAAWYFLRSGITEDTLDNDMAALAAAGFNTVLIPAVVTQETATSNTVEAPAPEYTAALEHGIVAARKHGLDVGLTGFLLVKDGAWRGSIFPTQKKEWAQSYFEAIKPHVQLAEDRYVPMFCMASEMESLKQDSKVWKYVLKKTREIYGGNVGFNMNWWYGADGFNFMLNKMEWMDDLDFIGVSSYFPLTDKNDPARDELTAAWSKDKNGQPLLEQFSKLKQRYKNQKIYVWEIGYRSTDGANTAPYNWQVSPGPDPGEQADCFAAFLGVFPQTQLDGFAIWDQYPGFSAGGPNEKGYDFIGKPAGGVVEEFLEKQDSM